MVSMEEEGDIEIVSGAASSVGDAHTLRIVGQRKEIKIVSLMILIYL